MICSVQDCHKQVLSKSMCAMHYNRVKRNGTIERVNKPRDPKLLNNPIAYGKVLERERIIKLLKIGGPIEKIICEYWGNDDYDKDDALAMIELAIKGETE